MKQSTYMYTINPPSYLSLYIAASLLQIASLHDYTTTYNQPATYYFNFLGGNYYCTMLPNANIQIVTQSHRHNNCISRSITQTYHHFHPSIHPYSPSPKQSSSSNFQLFNIPKSSSQQGDSSITIIFQSLQ